jgi:hypothetical protein
MAHILSSLAELAPALHAQAINTAVPANVIRAGVIFTRSIPAYLPRIR